MPNVLNEFVGDGVTRTFNFSMTGGYLSRDYVFFYTRPNEDLLAYTPYNDDDVTWISDYTVRTAAPIPVGTTFVILRSTTLDPLVDFQNTSRITEKNLDTATSQSIHIAAETSDMVGRIQVVATDAKLESADALLNAQAAAYDAGAAADAAIAASQAAGAAQAAALQAGADAGAAALYAQDAAITATAAEGTANSAAVAAATAVNTANTALNAASTAVSTANAADAAASAAVATANSANATAGVAAADASTAVSAATTAIGTANTAMTVANEAKSLIDDAVSGAVVSFNGRAGAVLPAEGDYTKALVGLGDVDNVSSAALRDRSTHTGTQAVTTVAGLQDTLNSKADISAGATHLSLNAPEVPTVGRLQVFQRSGDPEMMPDSEWWSLLRIQHPGYIGGYWQDFVMPFQPGGRPRVRQNADGVKSAWQELAYTSDVAPAVVAGYNTLTSAFGRTLANSADDSAARTTLGLGTAALDNSVANFYDNTPGRVLKVGSFGFGSEAIPKTTSLAEIARSGFHHTDGNTVGLSSIGGISVYNISLTLSPDASLNIGTPFLKSDENFGFRKYSGGSWGEWRWFLHTGNTTVFGRYLVQSSNNAEEAKALLGITQNIGVGAGQTWQNLTASRGLGVTYTNTTGRTIAVAVVVRQEVNGGTILRIGGVVLAIAEGGTVGERMNLSALVPAGATYSVEVESGAPTLYSWSELR